MKIASRTLYDPPLLRTVHDLSLPLPFPFPFQ